MSKYNKYDCNLKYHKTLTSFFPYIQHQQFIKFYNLELISINLARKLKGSNKYDFIISLTLVVLGSYY